MYGEPLTGWPQQKLPKFGFVFILLHYSQWISLPFCLPSLMVQWPSRLLLRMIVRLAYVPETTVSSVSGIVLTKPLLLVEVALAQLSVLVLQ